MHEFLVSLLHASPFVHPTKKIVSGKEKTRHSPTSLLTHCWWNLPLHNDGEVFCISVQGSYSELQSSKDDPQGIVDRFMSFLEDLRQTRLVAQSLARVTPRTANSDSVSSLSAKDALRIATNDRQRAASWIKAAMESSNLPPPTVVDDYAATDHSAEGKPSGTSHCSRFIPSGKRRLNYDMWLKGTGPLLAADLAGSLQGEGNRWLLSYIEKFLDGVLGDTAAPASENQIAGLLFQVKKVDEWLDGICCRDPHKDNWADNEEAEACERVRKKIYGVLLKNVSRAASALESMSVADDDGSASEGLE